MKKETIAKIFSFLEEKEDRNPPRKWVNLIKKLKLIKELIKELETLPDGMPYVVEGSLDLSSSGVKKLPNNLHVVGDLFLFDCGELIELPEKLYVGRGLFLSQTKIKRLPENLHVGEDLDVQESDIEEIPNNLYVGGSFYLTGTPLEYDGYTEIDIHKMVISKGGNSILNISI